jgi:hypothetical protein
LKEIQPFPALRMPPSTSGKPAHAQPEKLSVAPAFASPKIKKPKVKKIINENILNFGIILF